MSRKYSTARGTLETLSRGKDPSPKMTLANYYLRQLKGSKLQGPRGAPEQVLHFLLTTLHSRRMDKILASSTGENSRINATPTKFHSFMG